jgi:fibrillarin-like pre-rRNA processing protein
MESFLERDGKLYTENLVPGTRVYGEKLVRFDNAEYREWSPHRSKLSAYFKSGGKETLFEKGSNVLYLGAASGTTASHISDIANEGKVYCVEFSPRSFRDLVKNCQERKNMIPILGYATKPETYSFAVDSVDVVYQDVAQKNQSSIFLENMETFSCRKGMLCIKSRSEDVSRNPQKIFKESMETIEKNGYEVIEAIDLDRYEKDHMMLVVS